MSINDSIGPSALPPSDEGSGPPKGLGPSSDDVQNAANKAAEAAGQSGKAEVTRAPKPPPRTDSLIPGMIAGGMKGEDARRIIRQLKESGQAGEAHTIVQKFFTEVGPMKVVDPFAQLEKNPATNKFEVVYRDPFQGQGAIDQKSDSVAQKALAAEVSETKTADLPSKEIIQKKSVGFFGRIRNIFRSKTKMAARTMMSKFRKAAATEIKALTAKFGQAQADLEKAEGEIGSAKEALTTAKLELTKAPKSEEAKRAVTDANSKKEQLETEISSSKGNKTDTTTKITRLQKLAEVSPAALGKIIRNTEYQENLKTAKGIVDETMDAQEKMVEGFKTDMEALINISTEEGAEEIAKGLSQVNKSSAKIRVDCSARVDFALVGKMNPENPDRIPSDLDMVRYATEANRGVNDSMADSVVVPFHKKILPTLLDGKALGGKTLSGPNRVDHRPKPKQKEANVKALNNWITNQPAGRGKDKEEIDKATEKLNESFEIMHKTYKRRGADAAKYPLVAMNFVEFLNDPSKLFAET
jgi:hypothetical protein